MSKMPYGLAALVAVVAISAVGTLAQEAPRRVTDPNGNDRNGNDHKSVEVQAAFIVAAQQTIVAARDTGTLIQFSGQPGDTVKRDQRIGSLDSEETRLLVARAKLDLRIAQKTADDELSVESAERLLNESRHLKTQAELTRQIAQLRSTSDVAFQAATVMAQSAKAELDRANRSRERHKASFSQSEIDRLQLAHRNAQLEITKAKQDTQVAVILQQLEDSTLSERKEAVLRQELAVGKARNDRKMAALMKQQRELAVELAMEMHRRREMISSIDGEIAETFVEEGQWVKTGDKIARVVNLQTLRVEGYVKADYSRRQLKNAVAAIQVGSGLKRSTIQGRVVFVSPEVDRANRQFVVRIEFDNRKHGLTPGMPAAATLKLTQPTNASE